MISLNSILKSGLSILAVPVGVRHERGGDRLRPALLRRDALPVADRGRHGRCGLDGLRRRPRPPYGQDVQGFPSTRDLGGGSGRVCLAHLVVVAHRRFLLPDGEASAVIIRLVTCSC